MLTVIVASAWLAGATGYWVRHDGASPQFPSIAVPVEVLLVLWRPWVAAWTGTFLVLASVGTLVLAEQRRRRVRPRDIIAVLEHLATSLRSGGSPRQALAAAASTTTGPLGDDLEVLRRRVDLGLPLVDVVRSWPSMRPEEPAIASVSAALALAIASGGSAGRAVDEVADAVRARVDLDAETSALASQAKASAVVMAALPVLFVVVAGTADRGAIAALFTSTLGRLCLVTGLALDVVAGAWMMRIVRKVTR
jgi:tight adherence protein B